MITQEITSALFSISLSSHILASLLYLIASVAFRRNQTAGAPASTPLRSMAYGAVLLQFTAVGYGIGILSEAWVLTLCMLSYGIWIYSLTKLLETAAGQNLRIKTKAFFFIIWLFGFITTLWLALSPVAIERLTVTLIDDKGTIFASTISSLLLIVILAEQAFRNASSEYRAYIKYSLIGVTVLTTLQIYQLGYFYLFGEQEELIQYADGFINVVAALLFIMSAIRNQSNQALAISRTIAFYGTSLTLIGTFLLSMGIAGYFVKINGASWSSAIQLIIFTLTFLGVCYAAFSRRIRRTIRVLINKHFFRHKYDYRSVWLNLIQTLSNISEDENFHQLSLQAVGKIFDAHGGAMWLLDDEQHFYLATQWNIELPGQIDIQMNDAFIQAFINDDWIYAFGGGKGGSFHHHSAPPTWVKEIQNIWILSPFMVGKTLSGFFVLTRPNHEEMLIWEDIDVIKSASRQVASYIIKQRSAEQLAESKQFDTYNKLTAFIMHDLKNLIAQQALVVENAHKHKENPAFVEDAIKTIDNSVKRMSHLLKRLQHNPHHAVSRTVSVKQIVLEAIRKSVDRQPIPTLRTQMIEASVLADQDQLVMILLHVFRNAQDATNNEGFIDINLIKEQQQIKIEIEDNGHGMDEDFIKNRLFKPFESTKSSMGMGIGAYQVREFIQAMGGQIQVTSHVDIGTTICIQLPLSLTKNVS